MDQSLAKGRDHPARGRSRRRPDDETMSTNHPEPLRVVHLGKYYPPAPGGIETHTRTLARAQAERGASVRVFCMNHEGRATVVDRDGPVEVTRFGSSASLAKLELSAELVRALRRVEADVLHMQVPNPTMIVALLRARPRVPLVVSYQSDLVRQRVLGPLFRPLERLFYRQVRAILLASPTYAAGSRFLRPYGDRIEVLPLGIDLAPYPRPSAEHQAEAERAARPALARAGWAAAV